MGTTTHSRPGDRAQYLPPQMSRGDRFGPSSRPGFCNLYFSRSIESRNLYLLLVEWDSVEAHTDGFRMSKEYQGWKRLLHHFYEPFPTVEHFVTVP